MLTQPDAEKRQEGLQPLHVAPRPADGREAVQGGAERGHRVGGARAQGEDQVRRPREATGGRAVEGGRDDGEAAEAGLGGERAEVLVAGDDHYARAGAVPGDPPAGGGDEASVGGVLADGGADEAHSLAAEGGGQGRGLARGAFAERRLVAEGGEGGQLADAAREVPQGGDVALHTCLVAADFGPNVVNVPEYANCHS